LAISISSPELELRHLNAFIGLTPLKLLEDLYENLLGDLLVCDEYFFADQCLFGDVTPDRDEALDESAL
jgi:hypothetical protein